MKPLILEGVRIDPKTGEVNIDLSQDRDDDAISTKLQPFHKKLSTRKGYDSFIAYKFDKRGRTPSEISRPLQDFFKYGFEDSPEVKSMIKKSVNAFNKVYPLGKIDVVITPKSSSKLNKVIARVIAKKAGTNTMLASDKIVKSTAQDIKIDVEDIGKSWSKRVKQLLHQAHDTGQFTMKKIPASMRSKFSNFMTFSKDAERELYNKIENGNVVIVDDIYTTGNTLIDIIREINRFGPANVISFMFLSKP